MDSSNVTDCKAYMNMMPDTPFPKSCLIPRYNEDISLDEVHDAFEGCCYGPVAAYGPDDLPPCWLFCFSPSREDEDVGFFGCEGYRYDNRTWTSAENYNESVEGASYGAIRSSAKLNWGVVIRMGLAATMVLV